MTDEISFKDYLEKEFKEPVEKAGVDAWDLPIALSKRLQQERRKQQLSQRELADKLGLPQQDISKVENLSGGIPKLPTLVKIAAALGFELRFALSPIGNHEEQGEAAGVVMEKLSRIEQLFEREMSSMRNTVNYLQMKMDRADLNRTNISRLTAGFNEPGSQGIYSLPVLANSTRQDSREDQ